MSEGLVKGYYRHYGKKCKSVEKSIEFIPMNTNKTTTWAINLCEMCSANYSSVSIQILWAKVLSPPTPPPQEGARPLNSSPNYRLVLCIAVGEILTHYLRTYQGELKTMQDFFQAIQ